MYNGIEKFGYEYIKTLGKGGKGTIILVKKVMGAIDESDEDNSNLAIDDYCAIKLISKRQIIINNSKEKVEREIAIMKLLKHKNIIQFLDVKQDKNYVYIFMEYIDGIDLFDIITNSKLLISEILSYFRQIIDAIEYLHHMDICHRDIKPENIIVDKNGRIVVCDFGMSRLAFPLASTSCGSPHYCAPEILTTKNIEGEDKYDAMKADIWSLGVCLYTMTTNKLPFYDETHSISRTLKSIIKGEYTFPNDIDPDIKDLISHMIVKDPKKRYTIKQIKQHKIMQ